MKNSNLENFSIFFEQFHTEETQKRFLIKENPKKKEYLNSIESSFSKSDQILSEMEDMIDDITENISNSLEKTSKCKYHAISSLSTIHHYSKDSTKSYDFSKIFDYFFSLIHYISNWIFELC